MPITSSSTGNPKAPSPLRAVSSVILSMALIAVSNGMMHAYVPLRLSEEGFALGTNGWLLAAMGLGNFIGCFLSGTIVRRVGHARAFAVFAGFCMLATLSLAIHVDPWLWAPARMIYGIGVIGLFVVCQSWLNDATENQYRGRVLALFYVAFVASLGAGAEILRHVNISSNEVFLIGAAFSALALFPVSLTRLPPPAPPERVQIQIRRLWRVSPVGFAGITTVGALTMTVQGMIPVYFSAIGFSTVSIAFLVSRMQIGNIALQWPIGWLSDRIDRRYALLVAIALGGTASLAVLLLGTTSIWTLLFLCAIWVGATESIYAVSNAQINDRADPSEFVAMSSTALFLWSLGSTLGPAIAGFTTDILDHTAFFYVVFAAYVLLGTFIAYRSTVRDAPVEEETEPYVWMTPAAPVTAEFPPADGEEAAEAETAAEVVTVEGVPAYEEDR